VSWYAADGSGAANRIFSVGNTPATNGQTLTPSVSGALEFDPGVEPFGLVSRWPAFADRMVYSQDARNTFSGALPNHVRVYPLVRDGAAVPHAYVVATEEHISGFDYQDVVYVLRNVDPVTSADPDPGPGSGTTTKVNFGTETAPLPTGYLRDFGQAYGSRSGADQGSGLSYGWVNATTGQPEARTATGRDRDLNADQRLDTFMHMQYQQQGNPNCTVNNCNTGSWELAVPDGSYEVTAAVGDPKTNQDPEAHQLRAEGSTMFGTPFVPTGADGSAGHHSQATVVVEVTDGRLTLDAVGGTNTKVDYVEVTPVDGGGENGGENVVAQVDFAPQGSTPPQGWVTDSGELFTATRGYGWVRTEGGAAKTADTRTRTEETDPLDSTLMIVDDATVAAVTDGEWEYALPDGTYTVTTSVGDAGYADSTHGVSAEGVPLVAGFTPSAPGDYRQGTQTVQVNDGRLTLASTGTNTKLQWVTVATDSGVDATPPTVDLGVAGVDGPGGYVGKATVTADIADRGGSDIEFVDWTLDGEAVARPQGDVLVVDQLGNHTVAVKATDAAGNSTIREVSFSVVDGDTAAIEVTNLEVPRQAGEPIPGLSDDFLVMHLLASNVTTHRFRDTARLQISNTDADEPLVVTDLQMGAPVRPTAGVRAGTTLFSTSGTTLPLTIAPGDSATVPVRFSGPGTRGLYGATMTIVSNAENAPRLPVQLRGAWQPMPEGGQEVDLTQVARVFGWSTVIGEPLSEVGGGPLAGDEVRSRLWKRLDASKPVNVLQLAALHGCCTAEDRFAVTGTGGGGFSHDAAWGQSLLPPVATAGDAPATAPLAQGSYNPAGSFAVTVAGYSTDTTGNMGVRLFPVKVDGVAVPGAYVVGQDFVQNGCGGGSANCDYNDNMYLVTNVAPVAPVDTTGPADAPTGVQADLAGNDVRVDWSPVTAPDLGGYVVERQAAGATGWTRVNATPVSSTSLTDTGAPGNTSVTYRVLAVDTSANVSPASATASVTTPPRPQAAVRINAGGPAVTTSGVSWSAQQFGTGGKTYTNAVAIGNTSDDVLYQSEYSTATGNIAYDIPVQNGTYTVRLHFAEIYFGAPGGGSPGAGQRVFDVAVEGQLRLDDYDINADVGPVTAAVKEFPAQVTDGKVDVDLTSVVNQAKISAIEVVPN
jgi:hypothetical protein